mgnify:CR=1 FL=1
MPTTRLQRTAGVAALSALTAGPAIARDSGWTFDLTGYL